jgi:hypothetical protein
LALYYLRSKGLLAMTASERIRKAREKRKVKKELKEWAELISPHLEGYEPAYCDCLRCRIIRYTTES